MPYNQTGNDEDGNPTYEWADDTIVPPTPYYKPRDEDYTSGGYDDTFNYGAPVDPGTSDVGVGVGGAKSTDIDWKGLAAKFLGKAATPAGIAALGTGLMGLTGLNKPSTPPGWRGQINPNAIVANRGQIQQPAYVPYSGQPVMGRKFFTDTQYTPAVKAAQGGLMSFAAGGSTKEPRYLQGATDGMADKISTSIDGDQPAALSHGEFVIPADVVSHLGNGNSEAGAHVLYKMMDRVRQARTGNKHQGNKINPNKFTPGGIAGYAGGGAVAFTPGGAVTGSGLTSGQGDFTSLPVSQESNLSSWAGPGVADYIQKGTALSNAPYQAYTGPLTAGTSPLQQQGFQAASNLAAPAAMGQATNMAKSAGDAYSGLSYNPQTADSQFQAPNPYAAGSIKADQFTPAAMQQYMNPYLQASLDPQLAEARRQSQITQMGNDARATQSGAYGGGRNAIMDAETQRNLGTNLAGITGQGYNNAYNTALSAYGMQQGANLQAQQASEASRQFGAGQAMTGAQQAAQYGQAAQAQNAQQQQFGANFGLQGLQGQQSAAATLGSLGAQQNSMGLANLNAQLGAGATEQGSEQKGIDALRAQFEEQRLDPYKQVQFAQSLYGGLPVSTVNASTSTTPASRLGQAYGQGEGVYSLIDRLVNGTTTPVAAPVTIPKG